MPLSIFEALIVMFTFGTFLLGLFTFILDLINKK
ncbi:putative holin-like toxin [Lentibacillus sp. L22]